MHCLIIFLNIGDPWGKAAFTTNSKHMERAVLDYYAKLWHVPPNPADPDKQMHWGYVTSMGATEGMLAYHS
jgi:histidine decarboxylase